MEIKSYQKIKKINEYKINFNNNNNNNEFNWILINNHLKKKLREDKFQVYFSSDQ
jgi:hypothetical protein